jgi:hypothetical protein
MQQPLLILALSLLVFAGCKKNEPAEATQEAAPLPPEVNAQVEAQLVPPPTAKADAPAVERLNGAIHPELTARLQMYIEKTGRIPETIYEFSNTAVDSMPPAPVGMKYVIDPADKTVKAVRK